MNTGKTVSIYGYGRFGKFWADLLKENFHVKVFSRRGLKNQDVSPGIEICDEKEIYNCDAIFYCVAISALQDVLKEAKSYCRRETVFFDTCSVKMLPTKWMKEYLPPGSRIIATHPMFGPDSYQQTERQLPMVMCNISAETELFNSWADYFSKLSLQIEKTTPEEHDKMTACSQGITHYIGRILGDLQLQPSSIDTHGYKQLLKIIEQTCNDSRQLFLDLQNYNPYAKETLQNLNQSINKISQALTENDKTLLRK
jgi:prephenate dehydrogenase